MYVENWACNGKILVDNLLFSGCEIKLHLKNSFYNTKFEFIVSFYNFVLSETEWQLLKYLSLEKTFLSRLDCFYSIRNNIHYSTSQTKVFKQTTLHDSLPKMVYQFIWVLSGFVFPYPTILLLGVRIPSTLSTFFHLKTNLWYICL